MLIINLHFEGVTIYGDNGLHRARGAPLSPCSMRTAPIRLIWAGVNFGKLRSTQDWY